VLNNNVSFYWARPQNNVNYQNCRSEVRSINGSLILFEFNVKSFRNDLLNFSKCEITPRNTVKFPTIYGITLLEVWKSLNPRSWRSDCPQKKHLDRYFFRNPLLLREHFFCPNFVKKKKLGGIFFFFFGLWVTLPLHNQNNIMYNYYP